MGKTFRYDPESKKRKGKHRSNTAGLEEPASSFAEGWDWKKGCIDMDWAISRMATRVNCVVNDLIKDELICEGEREDYIAKYNAQLVKLARKYDPSRVGKNGRTSSPLHYLRIIEAGLTSNIRDYAIFRKKHFRNHTLVQTYDEAKETPGSVCVEDARMSDGCKNVKELELRMDIKVLEDMLNEEERICLAMRIEGYTQDEVAVEIGKCTGRPCDRDHVRKVVMIHLQFKARKCGFYPPSEKKFSHSSSSNFIG